MNRISGKYLKELREQNGYSLRTFAEMIYVSKSSVQRWEQSFVPENNDILQSISKVFNLSVEELRIQSTAKYSNPKTLNDSPTKLSVENVAQIVDDYKQEVSKPKLFNELSLTVKWIAVFGVITFIFSFIFLF